jgi:threonine dehydrogenase-like Zn-dependent dehydrogenase
MKALFLTQVGKSEVFEIDKPIPKSGEVLLKVEMVGFCGGDMNGFKGLFPLQEYPNILGHEVGAVIEELGADVPSHLRIGSKVTLYPYLACGTCVACRKGRPNSRGTEYRLGQSPFLPQSGGAVEELRHDPVHAVSDMPMECE